MKPHARKVDFSRTLADYAHRPAFPIDLFDRLRRFDVGLPNQTILDLGSGTGLLSRPLARRGGRVLALDLSPELLVEARRLDAEADVCIPLLAARAERLPLADHCVEVVTAAQCWHWFDRARAPREVFRVLRPGGRVAVIYQMYLPLPGTVAQRSEQLILRHHPAWRHANSVGINGQVLRDLQLAGFTGIESFSFDLTRELSHEAWRGLIRASSAVAASLSPEKVQAFDLEHARLLAPEPPLLSIPHRVFAAVATKPPGAL